MRTPSPHPRWRGARGDRPPSTADFKEREVRVTLCHRHHPDCHHRRVSRPVSTTIAAAARHKLNSSASARLPLLPLCYVCTDRARCSVFHASSNRMSLLKALTVTNLNLASPRASPLPFRRPIEESCAREIDQRHPLEIETLRGEAEGWKAPVSVLFISQQHNCPFCRGRKKPTTRASPFDVRSRYEVATAERTLLIFADP